MLGSINKIITRFLFPHPVQKDLLIAGSQRGVVSKSRTVGILNQLNPDAQVVVSGTQMPVRDFGKAHQSGSVQLVSKDGGIYFVGSDDASRDYTSDGTGLRVNEPLLLRILITTSRLISR